MPAPAMHTIEVVDSHTAGEPTRVVVGGGPDLGGGPLAGRCARFAREFAGLRAGIVCEPRGSDVWVGALLAEPHEPDCQAGVVFFNNAGTLGMCGHGAIGLVETLHHLGRLDTAKVRLDTPVGVVAAERRANGEVSFENVPSYRAAAGVVVSLPGGRTVTGDVAWGGNWFFLTGDHDLPLHADHIPELTAFATALRHAVNEQGHPEIDHVELTGRGLAPDADGRNFVLCPGLAYDRSPCGTGTSAKVACLAADGKLAEGERWVQEGILGTRFEARYRWEDGKAVATITGRAFITAESRLVFHQEDPFIEGIPA